MRFRHLCPSRETDTLGKFNNNKSMRSVDINAVDEELEVCV